MNNGNRFKLIWKRICFVSANHFKAYSTDLNIGVQSGLYLSVSLLALSSD